MGKYIPNEYQKTATVKSHVTYRKKMAFKRYARLRGLSESEAVNRLIDAVLRDHNETPILLH